MIYEIRTYELKPRIYDQFDRRVAEKIPARTKLSTLVGFWRTDIGPLNQVVHIWPYEDLGQRTEIRAQAVAGGQWPPDTAEFITAMESEIYLPAPFMDPMSPGDPGPIYEMRTYTYPLASIPSVLEAWNEVIEDRKKLSPLIGCWYSELGGLNKLVHIWAYRSLAERNSVREKALSSGRWPPRSSIAPLRMENKIMLPASFSPLQ